MKPVKAFDKWYSRSTARIMATEYPYISGEELYEAVRLAYEAGRRHARASLVRGEKAAFIEAVLNKDGPDAHPDGMYAMKYSDKFR